MTTSNTRLALALPVTWQSPSAAETLWSKIADSPVDFVALGLPRTQSMNRVLDPSIAAAVLQTRHSNLHLLVAASAEREHPYNIARRIGSLDAISNGRIGWLAVDRDAERTPGNSVWADAEPGPDLTADAVAAAIALWHTWPRQAIVADRARGVFIESDQIRFADHNGSFRSRGPLNIPSSTQGHPVIAALGESTPGADLVIRLPEVEDLTQVAESHADDAPQIWQTIELPHPAEDGRLFAVQLATARELHADGASIVVSLPAETDLELVTRVIRQFSDSQSAHTTVPANQSLRERLGLPLGSALNALGKSPYAPPVGRSSHSTRHAPERRSHIF